MSLLLTNDLIRVAVTDDVHVYICMPSSCVRLHSVCVCVCVHAHTHICRAKLDFCTYYVIN